MKSPGAVLFAILTRHELIAWYKIQEASKRLGNRRIILEFTAYTRNEFQDLIEDRQEGFSIINGTSSLVFMALDWRYNCP